MRTSCDVRVLYVYSCLSCRRVVPCERPGRIIEERFRDVEPEIDRRTGTGRMRREQRTWRLARSGRRLRPLGLAILAGLLVPLDVGRL